MCAASNAAVDHVMRGLLAACPAGLVVSRAGLPERVDPALADYTLEARQQRHPAAAAVRRMYRDAEQAMRAAGPHPAPHARTPRTPRTPAAPEMRGAQDSPRAGRPCARAGEGPASPAPAAMGGARFGTEVRGSCVAEPCTAEWPFTMQAPGSGLGPDPNIAYQIA